MTPPRDPSPEEMEKAKVLLANFCDPEQGLNTSQRQLALALDAVRAEALAEHAFDAWGVHIIRTDGTDNWWREVYETREEAAKSINASTRMATKTGHIATITPVKVRVVVAPEGLLTTAPSPKYDPSKPQPYMGPPRIPLD